MLSMIFPTLLYRIVSDWNVAANVFVLSLTLVLHLKIHKHTVRICNTTPYTTWHTSV